MFRTDKRHAKVIMVRRCISGQDPSGYLGTTENIVEFSVCGNVYPVTDSILLQMYGLVDKKTKMVYMPLCDVHEDSIVVIDEVEYTLRQITRYTDFMKLICEVKCGV